MAYTEEEIRRREDDLTATLDAENLEKMSDKRPDIVAKIRSLLEVGHTPKEVGKVIRRDNPQMWPESKFAESVARAMKAEEL